ncbi:hypothetical protein PybrP1_001556 [[Pythium] brassicae (nom. inval.)]|nr:hypothetical protein PybrP1_001556 [[Pythium] brassicae (nom. inval.)]
MGSDGSGGGMRVMSLFGKQSEVKQELTRLGVERNSVEELTQWIVGHTKTLKVDASFASGMVDQPFCQRFLTVLGKLPERELGEIDAMLERSSKSAADQSKEEVAAFVEEQRALLLELTEHLFSVELLLENSEAQGAVVAFQECLTKLRDNNGVWSQVDSATQVMVHLPVRLKSNMRNFYGLFHHSMNKELDELLEKILTTPTKGLYEEDNKSGFFTSIHRGIRGFFSSSKDASDISPEFRARMAPVLGSMKQVWWDAVEKTFDVIRDKLWQIWANHTIEALRGSCQADRRIVMTQAFEKLLSEWRRNAAADLSFKVDIRDFPNHQSSYSFLSSSRGLSSMVKYLGRKVTRCDFLASERLIAFVNANDDVALYKCNEAFTSMEIVNSFNWSVRTTLSSPLADILLLENGVFMRDGTHAAQSVNLRSQQISRKTNALKRDGGAASWSSAVFSLADGLVVATLSAVDNGHGAVRGELSAISSEDHRKVPVKLSLTRSSPIQLLSNDDVSVQSFGNYLLVADPLVDHVQVFDVRVTVGSDSFRIRHSGGKQKSARRSRQPGGKDEEDAKLDHWLWAFYHVFEKFPVAGLLDSGRSLARMQVKIVCSSALSTDIVLESCKAYFESIMGQLHKLNKPLEGMDLASNLMVCSKPAGHAGKCQCADGDHSCGEECCLIRAANCGQRCVQLVKHDGMHYCSVPVHRCGMPCMATNCSGTCILSIASPHTAHKCEQTTCAEKCLMDGCSHLCGHSDHFHGQSELAAAYSVENPSGKGEEVFDAESQAPTTHMCANVHACQAMCSEKGNCCVEGSHDEPSNTSDGAHSSFKYASQDMNGFRNKCAVVLAPGQQTHAGAHTCVPTAGVRRSSVNDGATDDVLSDDEEKQSAEETTTRALHYCEARCPCCSYFCIKTLGHSGMHTTSHGSMRDTNGIYLEERKFNADESGSVETCNLYCSRMGRGHVHYLECEQQDASTCVYVGDTTDQRRHCTRVLEPKPAREMDEVLHEQFWKTLGWEDPCASQDEREDFGKCAYRCDASDHTDKASFCVLPAWHKPELKPAQEDGLSYISGHKFECSHLTGSGKIHHVFVLDCSGSMQGHPWEQLLEAYRGYMRNRVNEGASLDLVSVVTFDDESKIEYEAKSITAMMEAHLEFRGGGTRYSAGLESASEVLSRNSFETHKPLVVFFSDGQPWDANQGERLATHVHESYAKYDLKAFVVGYASFNLSVLERVAEKLRGAYHKVRMGTELMTTATDDRAAEKVARLQPRGHERDKSIGDAKHVVGIDPCLEHLQRDAVAQERPKEERLQQQSLSTRNWPQVCSLAVQRSANGTSSRARPQ